MTGAAVANTAADCQSRIEVCVCVLVRRDLFTDVWELFIWFFYISLFLGSLRVWSCDDMAHPSWFIWGESQKNIPALWVHWAWSWLISSGGRGKVKEKSFDTNRGHNVHESNKWCFGLFFLCVCTASRKKYSFLELRAAYCQLPKASFVFISELLV